MKNFWGYVSNEEFSVGCTGQTVYLYDKDGNELKKFKDLIYAYTPMISPDGTLFVVKSADGRLAVYSLETQSLIKKFRFSKVDGAQDDGFCFSPDGKLFFNIECHVEGLHSAVSVYDTSNFSLIHRSLYDDNIYINTIEYDCTTNTYYVLGFARNETRVINNGFVAKYENFEITDTVEFSIEEYEFLRDYKRLELFGFTRKAYDWSYIACKFEELGTFNITLGKTFEIFNK